MTAGSNAAVEDRVLITGGSGFIGTNLVEHYMRRGAAVLSLDMKPPREVRHESVWRRQNLLDAETLKCVFGAFQPTVVFHLGARTDLHGRGISDYEANIRGVQNVVDAIANTDNVLRTVFASSRLVCRLGYVPSSDEDYCPQNPYGASKVAGEQIVRRSRDRLPHWTLVRPTSIWGPYFGVPYRDFFMAVLRGRYLHPRNTTIRKSFGYVGNTVAQLARIAQAPAPETDGATYYLADYQPIDVYAMANKIRRQAGQRPVRCVPDSALAVLARVGDQLQRIGVSEPPLTSYRLSNLCTDMVFDMSALEKIVGPLPIDLETGIAETLSYLEASGEWASSRRNRSTSG